jgi:hypothetical protein
MKRLLLVGILALAVPSVALAKGPSAASISGPGIGTIKLSGDSENGGTTAFGRLTEAAGFFQAVYRPAPDPMLRTRPKGELGPRYTVDWVLPTPTGKSILRQDLYPYAKPYPLSYMKRGQTFYGGMTTNGGWFVSGPELKQELVAAGLPSTPPSGSGSGLSSGALAGLSIAGAALLGLVVLVAVRLRRRPREALAA